MARKVPSSGINRFRSVLRLVREHEARHHRPCLDLSMGNPDGVPPPEVLALQSRLAGDPRRVLHTYAEDDDLAGFAGRMVELHTGIRLHEHEHLAVLPIPGIKTASALLPLACGLHRSPERLRLVTHVPAYDVVQTWGSAPQPIGSQLVIDRDGNFIGSVSGGCVEGAVVTEAVDVIVSGTPKLLEFGVADETAWQVGLACGGKIGVYVEPLS